MQKKVIIINGTGAVGKDTLCAFAAKRFKVLNVSCMDVLYKVAEELGWDGVKGEKARELLADLKKASVAYNDFPTEYIVSRHKEFLQSDHEIMFVHIREGSEIDKFKKRIEGKCVTLLVRREGYDVNWNNKSDDEVENYQYDYIFNISTPIRITEGIFLSFLEKSILGDE